MKKPMHPLRTWLTGLFAVLPLATTVLLLAWALQFLATWLGPGSLFGQLLTRIGLGVTGSQVAGYLVGVLLLVFSVYAFGLLVELGLQRGLARLVNALMQRIPVVRTVYDVTQKLVGLFAKPRGEEGLTSMSPVWLYFGGKEGERKDGQTTVVLGLLSTPEPIQLHGRAYHGVLVPTAPVPIGGGLLYVPVEWVEPAEMGMEGVTSIYVSMGVTSAQYIPRAVERA